MAIGLPGVGGPHAGLLDWLAGHGVEYEVQAHPLTYTAEATARAAHDDPAAFAKGVVVATDDGRHLMLVVTAAEHVDLAKARRALHAADVRILSEDELERLSPGCETGTMAPVPAVFGIPVVADLSLRDRGTVVFAAGSHRHSVMVDRGAWERACSITYADLARNDGEPAWDR
jgi:Ala-tRNA(Pro) deacylase